jgi:phage terminase large subunit-like protein
MLAGSGTDVWDMASMALRIPGPQGHAPCAVITTTPRMQALLKQIIAAPCTVVTRARTGDGTVKLSGLQLGGAGVVRYLSRMTTEALGHAPHLSHLNLDKVDK